MDKMMLALHATDTDALNQHALIAQLAHPILV